MKNKVRVGLVLGLVLSLMLVNVSSTAFAYTSDDLADGEWTEGTEVYVDASTTGTPEWLELLTEGTVITEPATLCHEFRGGQFYWVGQIRMLQDGEWVKVETTNKYVPNEEGIFMSCTNATQAGTYALFGYFDFAAAEAADLAAEESAQ